MILLTGASGFIGRKLSVSLTEKNIPFMQVVRNDSLNSDYVIDMCDSPSWSEALEHKRVVIHLAGLAHVENNEYACLLTQYRQVNVDATLHLAREAASAGVQRFIFISSISVIGNSTSQNKPFTEDDLPSPKDITGISKLEAEQGLKAISNETGMEIVIIRSPLVYGPGAKGNFARLMKLVAKGLPLPFGAIQNQRSLVAVDNLVDLIITCIEHPRASNQTFLAGDGHDLSTTELLIGIAKAMGRPIILIPVPVVALKLMATLVGKKSMADRLFGSLQVDISKTEKLLGWHPPISVEEGLKRCFSDMY